MPRRPKAARGDGADNILAAAETLIGLHGVDAVSMRQITQAAGMVSPNSVQYHYGDKARLIQAIVDSRQPYLEARRGELLDALLREGKAGDVRALIEASLRPLTEIKDGTGVRNYIRLLWQIRRPQLAGEMSSPIPNQPNAAEISRRLKDALTHVPGQLLAWRQENLLFFFLNCVVLYDMTPAAQVPASAEASLNDCLDMFAAAVSAPVGAAAAKGA